MPSSAFILVIDRLGAGFLGPYGNTWLETLAFNSLAARSLLCEQVLASSPDLSRVYRDYWFTSGQSASLAQLARQAGYRSILVTDEPALKQLDGAADFEELHFVDSDSRPAQPAEDVAETGVAALMEVALSQLATWKATRQPQLLWIHASSLDRVWDAPMELRAQFGDEDDPPPSATVAPPNFRLGSNHDPDELLSLSHAYAGQVTLLDWGLESLLIALDELPQRDDLVFAFTSPRGYPLGEHGRVGRCDDALYNELLHVPLLIQFPGKEGALLRTQELLQPASLAVTLADALRGGGDESASTASLLRLVRGEGFADRQLAISTADNQRVIRSAAWQLRETIDADGPRYELFTKPDDRWEFNDVASRCPEIVELLLKQASELQSAEIPDVLRSPWR